jgi:hypothetical protein
MPVQVSVAFAPKGDVKLRDGKNSKHEYHAADGAFSEKQAQKHQDKASYESDSMPKSAAVITASIRRVLKAKLNKSDNWIGIAYDNIREERFRPRSKEQNRIPLTGSYPMNCKWLLRGGGFYANRNASNLLRPC